jgi:hypothetical protein
MGWHDGVMSPPPTHLDAPDLEHDSQARPAVKDECVVVQFARTVGRIGSAVGENVFATGDALVTGSTGDSWVVSRARFDAKYRPEPPTRAGEDGHYRNLPVTVLAKPMTGAFTVARSAGGDVLRGEPGDWLVQYAPGDHGVVARARFERVYRLLESRAAE